MKHRADRLYRKLNLRARHLRFRYLRWQNAHVSQGLLLIAIALLLGILTGTAAAVLKALVRFLTVTVLSGIKYDGTPHFRFLIFPIAGIFLTSIYKRYVCREDITTGTKLIKQRLNAHKYNMSMFDIFNPLIGCSITMGLGASAGTEGPTAMSGASIGSCIARWFRLSSSWRRLLLGIGAGAGIAAIFKAPLGGALFTLEVLQMELTTLPIVALILSCLFAAATAYFLSNFSLDISFVRDMPMDIHTIGWVALLGVFCGLYSVYYNFSKDKSAAFFSKIKNPWIAATATGLCLSIGVFMFPALYGEGFHVITDLVNGYYISLTDFGLFAGHSGSFWLLGSLVVILLIKGVLVAASYSGGGIAGDFVPTFFAGAMAGALFGFIVNHLTGNTIPIWYFSLIGMGCVMAGAIHAPLMAIFLISETTNTYIYIFPYILAIMISYGVVKIITPKAWYSETGSDDVLALLKLRQTPNLISPKSGDNKPQDQK